MYETPELGKLNGGGGDAAPTSGLYQNDWVAVDQYLLGVVVGILFLAIFQIDTTYPISTPNGPEIE